MKFYPYIFFTYSNATIPQECMCILIFRPVARGLGGSIKPPFQSHTHVYYCASIHTCVYYTSIHFSKQTQVPIQGSAENVSLCSNSKNNTLDYQNITIFATWYTFFRSLRVFNLVGMAKIVGVVANIFAARE